MSRTLFLDDDSHFIIEAQKILPNNYEWLATSDIQKAEKLLEDRQFDIIVVRKHRQKVLHRFINQSIDHLESDKTSPFKKIIILPRYCWRAYLKKKLSD